MPPVEELDVMFTELVVSRMPFSFFFPFFVSLFLASPGLVLSFQASCAVKGASGADVGSSSILNLELCSSLKSCQFEMVCLSLESLNFLKQGLGAGLAM